MSDLGTYSLDEKKLQIGNDNLKNHTKQLKSHLDQSKLLLRMNPDIKLSEYMNLLEEKVLPVLEKYTSKMEELLIDTIQTEKDVV